MTIQEIAMAVFVTEVEAGLHEGLSFEQWYASKTESNDSESNALDMNGNKLEATFTINSAVINGMTEQEVTAVITTIVEKSVNNSSIFLEITRVPTVTECNEIISKFPKSYKMETIESHKNLTGNSSHIWIKTDENKQLSKAGLSKFEKFLAVAKELGIINS